MVVEATSIASDSIGPLFMADMDSLKARLRLSGAAADDALAIIDHAVQQVRVGFYSRLSSNRISTLRATSSVENPTETNQVLRSLAEQTEVMWVRYELMQQLPNMFIDGSGNTQTTWNQEGLTREIRPAEKEEILARLWSRIQSFLNQLAKGELSASSISASTIEPDETQPRPGASVGLDWRRPLDCRTSSF